VAQCSIDIDSDGGAFNPVTATRRHHRQFCDWTGTAAATPQLVQGGVHGHPVGPRGELTATSKIGQTPRQGDQGLLRCIGSVGVIPGQAAANSVQAGVLLSEQLFERRAVPALCRPDQVLARVRDAEMVAAD
jgi:hypothetical protein